MAEKMNWLEIKKKFPNEWIALANYEQNGAIEVEGTVIVHHPNKKNFHETVRKLRTQYPHIAVRYTGKLIQNSEIPLLWQITPTN